jgi:hypothetical protein
MSRGLKFDLLLAVSLAYGYMLLTLLPLSSEALSRIFGSASGNNAQLLAILLLTVLITAPALVVFWCRRKDRKALRFFILWLLALGGFFFDGQFLLKHFTTLIGLPLAIILLWAHYFRSAKTRDLAEETVGEEPANKPSL